MSKNETLPIEDVRCAAESTYLKRQLGAIYKGLLPIAMPVSLDTNGNAPGYTMPDRFGSAPPIRWGERTGEFTEPITRLFVETPDACFDVHYRYTEDDWAIDTHYDTEEGRRHTWLWLPRNPSIGVGRHAWEQNGLPQSDQEFGVYPLPPSITRDYEAKKPLLDSTIKDTLALAQDTGRAALALQIDYLGTQGLNDLPRIRPGLLRQQLGETTLGYTQQSG